MEVIACLAVLEAAAGAEGGCSYLLPLQIRTRIAHKIGSREHLVGFPRQVNTSPIKVWDP
jgi:hypothetical protein